MELSSSKEKRWANELEELEKDLRELQKKLPAHSIRPHQWKSIEDLEERIRDLKKKIQQNQIDKK